MSKTYIQTPTTPELTQLYHLGYRVIRNEQHKYAAKSPEGLALYYGDYLMDAWAACVAHNTPTKHQQTSIEGKSGKIKIYFAGSIRGGRDLQPVYNHIIRYLQSQHYDVLSEHIGNKTIETKGEQQLTDSEIFIRDTLWIMDADVLIEDVTVPSLGVGYEICYAEHVAKIPILTIAQEETNVSAMISGSSHTLVFYSSSEQLEREITDWLYKFKRGQLS